MQGFFAADSQVLAEKEYFLFTEITTLKPAAVFPLLIYKQEVIDIQCHVYPRP